MKYQLINGKHGIGNMILHAGDVIESDTDLAKSFPNKFVCLDAVISSEPVAAIHHSDPALIGPHKISILCPTRGRPVMAQRFADSVQATAAYPANVELLFYVDSDDPKLAEYKHNITGATVVVGPPVPVGVAWNVLAKQCCGEMLMMGNDDLVAVTPGWDKILVAEVKKYSDGIYVAWFNDGIHGPKHCAFPIVSHRWYDLLGYFVPECFLFGYNDTWLMDLGGRVGRLHHIATATVEHQHFSTGKTPRDATTERNRDDNQFKRDKVTFNEQEPRRVRDAAILHGATIIGGAAYKGDGRLLDMLNGKRVALVGPGHGLLGTGMGPVLDQYDVVCRVNECWPFGYEDDYGNKTDIVFHNFASPTIHNFKRSLAANEFLTSQLSFCIAAQTYENTKDSPIENFGKVNATFAKHFHHVGDTFWHHLARELGRSPNTGFVALCMLLEYPLAELLITGFSFYVEGTEPEVCHHPAYLEWGGDRYKQLGKPTGMHAQEPQMKYMCKVLLPKWGNTIKLDSSLDAVLGAKHTNVLDLHPKHKPARYRIDRALAALVDGKRVAIVGPGPHLVGSKAGKALDKYDVVCRVNELFPFGMEKDYGSRTDLLFHCCGAPSLAKLADTVRAHPGITDQIKLAVCPQAEGDGAMVANWEDSGLPMSLYMVGDAYWFDMSRRVGVCPNTGLLAIMLLLEQYKPTELFVTGFSFYEQGPKPEERHYPAYIQWGGDACNGDTSPTHIGQVSTHNQTMQKAYFQGMVKRFRKLKVDKYLKELLKDPIVTTPKIGRDYTVYAVYRALHGAGTIEASLRSVLSHAEKAFVFWTDKAFGDVTGCNFDGARIEFPKQFDNVVAVVKKLKEEFGDRIVLEYDHWGKPDNQFTHFVNDIILPKHRKPDIVLCMAPDMVWRRDQLAKALQEFVQLNRPCATCGQVELWKTYAYRVPERKHRVGPVFWCTQKLDVMPVSGKGGDGNPMDHLTAKVHNVGFCSSPRMMFWKHLLGLGFGTAIGDSLANETWYFDKWLAWDAKTNNTDLEISKGHEADIPCAKPYDISKLPEELR